MKDRTVASDDIDGITHPNGQTQHLLSTVDHAVHKRSSPGHDQTGDQFLIHANLLDRSFNGLENLIAASPYDLAQASPRERSSTPRTDLGHLDQLLGWNTLGKDAARRSLQLLRLLQRSPDADGDVLGH